MATTFTVNRHKIKTKFGDLALCRYCNLRYISDQAEGVCVSGTYPFWDEGWCQQFMDYGFRIGYKHAKKMCAEAYADGMQREAEEQGAERYREPVLDESRD